MQTKFVSAIEAAANTTIGYVISVAIGQLIVYPLFQIPITLSQNMAVTAIFVAASLMRSYGFRRLFSRWLNKVINRWTKKLKVWWQIRRGK